MAADQDGARGPDVDRGPQETRQPSRLAFAVVGAGAVVVMVLLVVAGLTVPDRILDEGETLLEQGQHAVTVGPVEVTADLTGGDWILRGRCDRWTQLSAASDDAETLHLVWVDAVPEPSTVGDVELVEPPDDLVAWWRDRLELAVTPIGTTTVDGHPAERHRLEATDTSRREDGLVACGEVGGVAATGLLGPAARFDQQVALVDVDGTTLLVIGATYVGGDPEQVAGALEDLLATASIERQGGAGTDSGGG